MENAIFDAENFKIQKIQFTKHKSKAKTNKTKLCMSQKAGANLFAVYTCASVAMCFNTVQ